MSKNHELFITVIVTIHLVKRVFTTEPILLTPILPMGALRVMPSESDSSKIEKHNKEKQIFLFTKRSYSSKVKTRFSTKLQL